MVSEAQIKAQKKYDAENTMQVHLKLKFKVKLDFLEDGNIWWFDENYGY